MTRAEAINRLETCLECPDCFTCADHDKAIEAAITALREQEQREQGCEWCNNLQSKPCHACAIKYDHFYCGEGHPNFHKLPYKFCPMCGRRLED